MRLKYKISKIKIVLTLNSNIFISYKIVNFISDSESLKKMIKQKVYLNQLNIIKDDSL